MATDIDSEFITPEIDAEATEPPKRLRGRPKKQRDESGQIIVDDTPPTPKPRTGRKPKERDYTRDIETALTSLFDLPAMFDSPTWKIGNGIDEASSREEIEKVHNVAEAYNRWFHNLAEDSVIRKYFEKAADTSPLLIACVGLSHITLTKYMVAQMYKQHLRENGNPVAQ